MLDIRHKEEVVEISHTRYGADLPIDSVLFCICHISAVVRQSSLTPVLYVCWHYLLPAPLKLRPNSAIQYYYYYYIIIIIIIAFGCFLMPVCTQWKGRLHLLVSAALASPKVLLLSM